MRLGGDGSQRTAVPWSEWPRAWEGSHGSAYFIQSCMFAMPFAPTDCPGSNTGMEDANTIDGSYCAAVGSAYVPDGRGPSSAPITIDRISERSVVAISTMPLAKLG